MKLLLDHNLSPRLVSVLRDLYPGSVHVRELELQAHHSDLLAFEGTRDLAFLVLG